MAGRGIHPILPQYSQSAAPTSLGRGRGNAGNESYFQPFFRPAGRGMPIPGQLTTNLQLNSDSMTGRPSGNAMNGPSFAYSRNEPSDGCRRNEPLRNQGFACAGDNGNSSTVGNEQVLASKSSYTAGRDDKNPSVGNGSTTATTDKVTTWAEIHADMCRVAEEKWKGLPPVKKQFYSEHPEIKRMTEQEAADYRSTRNNISVIDRMSNAKRTPLKPVNTFEHAFHNYPMILDQIRRQNFKEPSPIQSQMWPIALNGEDVIGIAQTGTGKTLAFLLPVLIHLDNQAVPRDKRGGPGCIIMLPTRELALQIHTEVQKYNYKGIKSVCIYGGGSRREQINVCTAGADIVIATPGRLNDLVAARIINLKSVTFLVLDEADRMLDLGFEPQIKKVLFTIRPDRQTIMTSATWPPLVRELGERYTRNAFLIFVGCLDLSAARTVTQDVRIMEEDDKMAFLMGFLKNMKQHEKVIIFVARKSLADHLSSDLICKGLDCQSLHGDRDQGDREQALADIKGGRVSILVATDLASRGLDIPDITHVFNYDFPRNIEEYVHRVGRTGRAGRCGISITLITRSDWRHSTELVKILEEAGQDIPEELRRMSDRYEFKKQQPRGPRPRRGDGDEPDIYGGFVPSSGFRNKF